MKIAKILSTSLAILSLNFSSVLANPVQPSSVTPLTYQLTGTLKLIDSQFELFSDNGCAGYRGFGDLHQQSAVIIYDDKQNIIAKGSVVDTDLVNNVTCLFSFNVSNIPKANFYTVQIGNRKMILSFDELVEKKWNIELYLSS